MALEVIERRAGDLIAEASEWAKHLTEIVNQRKWFTNISGKRFLHFEAWQTVARFDRCNIAIEAVELVDDHDGAFYKAKANLMRDGIVVGSAVAICGLDSFVTRGKRPWDEQHRAAQSAAQTFAARKVCQLNYGFVAVLAGYEPSEAEDTEPEPPGRVYCEEHRQDWTRRRDGQYSHPYQGEGNETKWCNYNPRG